MKATWLLLLVLGSTAAYAEPAPQSDELWKVRSAGGLRLDAGLIMGLPATWQTGLSSGVGAGLMHGRTLVWGLRASWSTATESSLAWTVNHQDIRLRATTPL